MDFSPASKVVPRAIVLQVVEGGEVDVHHATLIWDAVLPSGETLQRHTPVDAVLVQDAGKPASHQEATRKLLLDAVWEVRKLHGFK